MSNSDRSQSEVRTRRKNITVRRDDVTPPHNIEAEKSVLGAMMIDPVAAAYAGDALVVADFWRPPHQVLFQACHALLERRVALDFTTIHAYLKDTKTVDEAGGIAYVASLTDGVPRAVNVTYYIGILQDLRVKRQMLHVSDKILAEIFAGENDGSTIAQMADGWVLDVEHGHGEGDLIPQSVAVPELWKDMERRMANKGSLTGINTGLTTLNEMTGGWQPGNLIIIAARPSCGKTALACNMAITAARAGVKVAFFSLEMTRQQVEYRFLSSISGVMLFKILNGFLGSADYAKISYALSELSDLPISITDNPQLTFTEIRGRCRRQKVMDGLGLIVVDYVQLLGGTSDSRRFQMTRSEELGYISRRFKLLSKELNVPTLLLSQLNRASEGREDQRPRMKDLRESGSLEQDSDDVLLIHRPDHKVDGKTELILEKQRNGPTGPFEVTFTKETTTFSDVVASATPAEEPPPIRATRTRKRRSEW